VSKIIIFLMFLKEVSYTVTDKIPASSIFWHFWLLHHFNN